MRRFSSFMLWVLLGFAVAIVPIACSSSSSTDDAAQAPTDSSPDSVTQS